jgi:hypothetical protein
VSVLIAFAPAAAASHPASGARTGGGAQTGPALSARPLLLPLPFPSLPRPSLSPSRPPRGLAPRVGCGGRERLRCFRRLYFRVRVRRRAPKPRFTRGGLGRLVVLPHIVLLLLIAPCKNIPVKKKWPYGAGQGCSGRAALRFNQA